MMTGDWAVETHTELKIFVEGLRANGAEALQRVEEAREQLRPLDWLSDLI